MLIKRAVKIVALAVACSIRCIFLFSLEKNLNVMDFSGTMHKSTFTIQSAYNDTAAPIIVFIQPEIDDTTVSTKSYNIIVNVTDDNRPLPGNVSIESTNDTASLFNASMTLFNKNEWNLTWDNITSYPNEMNYYFQDTAKDSSTNENIGMSGVILVYVAFYNSSSPKFFLGILSIIIASIIIACVLVYLNKRIAG
ncbi:MAG: hypothetical protein ACFFG0_28660 [Candidatus Thorarchaeota archaeon]